MSRPTVLAFNLNESRLSKLKFICMKCGLLLKNVPEADFTQPIGALCGMADRVDSPEAAAPFTGEMLVMCRLDNASANRFLTTMKQMRFAPITLKALLTPTNAAWTANQLHDELTAEREAVMQQETTAHETPSVSPKADTALKAGG